MADLLLASASPRRKELLDQIGVKYIARPMNIDETVLENETASAYVERLAVEKATTGLKISSDLAVLAADTSVVIGDRILGKPETEQEAMDMLALLSGCSHKVMTGIAMAHTVEGLVCLESNVVTTEVHFLEITPELIKQYVATKEPMDKAGAYGIQGKAAVFVDRIEGSYSNVVGLPLEMLGIMLQRFNIPFWQA